MKQYSYCIINYIVLRFFLQEKKQFTKVKITIPKFDEIMYFYFFLISFRHFKSFFFFLICDKYYARRRQ